MCERHCEERGTRDDAIQEWQMPSLPLLDCFASLAMTGLGVSSVLYPRSPAQCPWAPAFAGVTLLFLATLLLLAAHCFALPPAFCYTFTKRAAP